MIKNDPRRRDFNAIVQSQSTVAGNYGGLLQAYSLQRTLRDLGVSAETNSWGRMRPSLRSFASSAKALVRDQTLDRRIPGRMKNAVGEQLIAFAEKNMELPLRPYSGRKLQNYVWRSKPRFLIAGSDQVWRPRYSNVLQGAFDFPIPPGTKRIAYAASFGLDNASEFDAPLNAKFGRALRSFDAVSVREDSGVTVCSEEWGVPATQVLDPTMLLDVTHWNRHADGAPELVLEHGAIASLLLDENDEISDRVRALANAMGLPVQSFYPPVLTSRRAFRSDPTKFILPSVGRWLGTIKHSKLVITDSFHVTVFCILFHTPFWTVSNNVRGNARLRSLTQMFGLEEQLLPDEALGEDTGVPSIDWERVDHMLEVWRDRSWAFLLDALGLDEVS